MISFISSIPSVEDSDKNLCYACRLKCISYYYLSMCIQNLMNFHIDSRFGVMWCSGLMVQLLLW